MTDYAAFSPVTTAEGLVSVSGMTASEGVTGVEAQVADVLGRLDARLRAHGSSLDRALSLHVQVRDAADFAAVNRAYAPFFPVDPPARTTVVAPPEEPRALVEIAAVGAGPGVAREVIRPDGWVSSPNPYSYAIRSGDLVYLSGLVPRDGRTGEVVGGDLARQATVIFDNATDILQAAGLTLADVASARLFLTDRSAFGALNDIYRTRMPAPRPARATVIAGLMNPQYLVEMTFVAATRRHLVAVPGAPPPVDAVLSPAITAGSRVFVSGMLGDDPTASLEVQTRSMAARLQAALEAAGAGWDHVVEMTLYVTDPACAPVARQTLAAVMGRPLPAGQTLVVGLLRDGATVEVMLTALRP